MLNAAKEGFKRYKNKVLKTQKLSFKGPKARFKNKTSHYKTVMASGFNFVVRLCFLF